MGIGKVHYLHFSIILWAISGMVTIAVSLITPPIADDYLHRLTWKKRLSSAVRRKRRSEDVTEEENEKLSEFNKEDNATVQLEVNNLAAGNSDSDKLSKRFTRMCCTDDIVESGPKDERTEEQKAQDKADFLKEDPFWKRFVDINIVICICFSVFGFAFFS